MAQHKFNILFALISSLGIAYAISVLLPSDPYLEKSFLVMLLPFIYRISALLCMYVGLLR